MDDLLPFAHAVLLVAAVCVVAVGSNRLAERLHVPAPALFLIVAAVASDVVPRLGEVPIITDQRIVTVALTLILFDGGIHIGWDRMRPALAGVAWIGMAGTLVTTAALAVLAHVVFGFEWQAALLIGAALAPTDPAVVFSVLGRREITGRSGTLLEGESGANDPVGIAIMVSLIAAGGLSWSAAGDVGLEFVLQMVVGALVGLVGAPALLWFMRRVSLPNEGLYAIRTLACALALFGAATLLHGSGFLAVFVAGILIGDERAPYKREIERFHSALASLGEIVAFAVLGLTVDLEVLTRANVLVPGLVLAAVIAFVVRPIAVGLCVAPAKLKRNETAFVMFAGLKGAVPLLLGELIIAAHVPDAERLFGIVAVVVIFSVLVQGSLTPVAADVLKIPMHPIEPEPWALGIRLRDEPEGVHRFRVRSGAPAEGRRIADLDDDLPEQAWISFVVRDSGLVMVSGDTELHAGDDILMLGAEDCADQLRAVFEG